MEDVINVLVDIIYQAHIISLVAQKIKIVMKLIKIVGFVSVVMKIII